MSPQNADILFLYGRSLFKVGQLASDILGGGVAVEKKKQKSNGEKKKANGAAAAKQEAVKAEEKSALETVAEEGATAIAEQNGSTPKLDEPAKPLFQFTGDENFDDSEDEAEVHTNCNCAHALETLY
jgi:HAT1-interacting factor 1